MLIQSAKIRRAENLTKLLGSLTNILTSRNYRRILVGFTRNYTKMRKLFRKFEKRIASLLGVYKPSTSQVQAKYM